MERGGESRGAQGVPLCHVSRSYGISAFPERPDAPGQSQPVCCISAARMGTTRFAEGSRRTPGHQALHRLHTLREGRTAARSRGVVAAHRHARVRRQAALGSARDAQALNALSGRTRDAAARGGRRTRRAGPACSAAVWGSPSSSRPVPYSLRSRRLNRSPAGCGSDSPTAEPSTLGGCEIETSPRAEILINAYSLRCALTSLVSAALAVLPPPRGPSASPIPRPLSCAGTHPCAPISMALTGCAQRIRSQPNGR